MSFKCKKSKSAVEEAGEKWTHNLKSSTKRRPSTPQLKQDISKVLCNMPSNRDIVGRFLGLFDELKGRHDRLRKISEELVNLWHKLNFPVLSKQQVCAKVDKLITAFEKHRKRPNAVYKDNLHLVFDITKTSGNWLCSEDKELYKLQLQSGGRVGYTTVKVAPMSTIHPSKRCKSEASTSQAIISVTSESEEGISSVSDYSEAVPEDAPRKRAVRHSTKSAAKVVSKLFMSTRKTSQIANQTNI